jgi:hypothetical protein
VHVAAHVYTWVSPLINRNFLLAVGRADATRYGGKLQIHAERVRMKSSDHLAIQG